MDTIGAFSRALLRGSVPVSTRQVGVKGLGHVFENVSLESKI